MSETMEGAIRAELAAIRTEVVAFREQASADHKALLRFLGHMKDRLPEGAPWDRFAAAALEGFIARTAQPFGYDMGPVEIYVQIAVGYADLMLAERTKREEAALEAKKTKADKQ